MHIALSNDFNTSLLLAPSNGESAVSSFHHSAESSSNPSTDLHNTSPVAGLSVDNPSPQPASNETQTTLLNGGGNGSAGESSKSRMIGNFFRWLSGSPSSSVNVQPTTGGDSAQNDMGQIENATPSTAETGAVTVPPNNASGGNEMVGTLV